jgi:hypothetical protein
MFKHTVPTVALQVEDQIKIGGEVYYVSYRPSINGGRYRIELTSVSNAGLELAIYAPPSALFKITRP